MMLRAAAGAALVGSLVACSAPAPAGGNTGEPVRLRVEVIDSYPHDPTAFTQGLELHDQLLYEGTGLYAESEIRTVDPQTGQVDQTVSLPPETFGEGITLVGDQLWQLTWKEQTAFRRDRSTLAEVGRASYSGEGWGLCYDQPRDRLVMSDGTAELTFRNPASFEPTGTVAVTREGEPLAQINELECAGDRVWANVWQTDEIVRIDPDTGAVEAVVDASGLLSTDEQAGADVLNGIAAAPGFGGRAEEDLFLVTGKLWPRMFLVRFVEPG
ncbi:MAG: glutaminyl-peptide cyclotransferase [Micromonosporaceae bacterium]|nr:glutaminyl-peptide cyclotransferase [Micromonosporaceae bacterium]